MPYRFRIVAGSMETLNRFLRNELKGVSISHEPAQVSKTNAPPVMAYDTAEDILQFIATVSFEIEIGLIVTWFSQNIEKSERKKTTIEGNPIPIDQAELTALINRLIKEQANKTPSREKGVEPSSQWNRKQFEEFVRLRDDLRAAKRAKDYQQVLSLGLQILELDKVAKFIQITTPIFLKDMGNACIKLGDNAAAVKYFEDAVVQFTELKAKSGEWQDQIDVIQKKLKKLQTQG